jgi:hypothetical protein
MDVSTNFKIPQIPHPMTPLGDGSMPLIQSGVSAEDWSFLSRFAMSSLTSSQGGTVGGMLISGLVSPIANTVIVF